MILAGNVPLLSGDEDLFGREFSHAQFRSGAFHAADHARLADCFLEPSPMARVADSRIARKQRPARHGSRVENHRRTCDGDVARRHSKIVSANRRSTCARNAAAGVYSVVMGKLDEFVCRQSAGAGRIEFVSHARPVNGARGTAASSSVSSNAAWRGCLALAARALSASARGKRRHTFESNSSSGERPL